MHFVMETQFGVRKIYTLPGDDIGAWRKREIVADFVAGPAGDLAFNSFKAGLAAYSKGSSLFCRDTGQYLIGTLDQLDRGQA